MTALRTAAKQALEALESLYLPGELKRVNASITALKAALEQPDQAEPVEIKPPPNPEGAAHCIMRWMAETPAGWVGAWDRAALAQFVTQTRREWRSLTDEEIKTVVGASEDFWATSALWIKSVARAVEAALRRKNHG